MNDENAASPPARPRQRAPAPAPCCWACPSASPPSSSPPPRPPPRCSARDRAGPQRAGHAGRLEPAHVPVLLDRCLALLAPALTTPGRRRRRLHARHGRARAGAARAHPRPARRPGPRPRGAAPQRRPGSRRSRSRTTLVHAVYDELPGVLADLGLARVQGVLFDLGVSSLQLDEADRGFAYAQDGPLDMRMDQTRGLTAADIVNTWPGKEIARVLKQHGDERFASRIADAVVRERAREPFTGTARLAELVRDAIPAATRRTGGHPAKRTFQALRIEVNDELGVLRRAIPAAIDHLAVGGRIVVMSYQSLEDKVVKAELVARSTSEVPARPPLRPRGRAARAAAAGPRQREGPRRRAGRQPALAVGAAARRRARAGRGVSAATARVRHRADDAPRPAGPAARRSAARCGSSRSAASAARGPPSSPSSSACSPAGLLGLLALNTVLAHDAFRLHELQVQGKQARRPRAGAADRGRALQAPARRSAARAERDGHGPGRPAVVPAPARRRRARRPAPPGIAPQQPSLVGASAVPVAPERPGGRRPPPGAPPERPTPAADTSRRHHRRHHRRRRGGTR